MLETTDQVQLLETCVLYLIVYPPKRLTHVELFWVLFYLLLFTWVIYHLSVCGCLRLPTTFIIGRSGYRL